MTKSPTLDMGNPTYDIYGKIIGFSPTASTKSPTLEPIERKIRTTLQNFAVCRDLINVGKNDDNSDFYCSMKMCFDGYSIEKAPIDDLFDRAVAKILNVSSPLVSNKLKKKI